MGRPVFNGQAMGWSEKLIEPLYLHEVTGPLLERQIDTSPCKKDTRLSPDRLS